VVAWLSEIYIAAPEKKKKKKTESTCFLHGKYYFFLFRPSCGVKFYLLDIITIAQIGIHNSQRILICPYETYAGPRHTQSIAAPPSLLGGYIIIHHSLGGICIPNHAIQIAVPESVHAYEDT
jgi:hypothetical protein